MHSGSVQSRMLHCNRLCRSGLSADSVRMDFVRCVCVRARLASAAGAFLLKIAIEERLGYPVMLIVDGLVGSVESALNLTGPASV